MCAIGRCVFCRLLQGDASGEPLVEAPLVRANRLKDIFALGKRPYP